MDANIASSSLVHRIVASKAATDTSSLITGDLSSTEKPFDGFFNIIRDGIRCGSSAARCMQVWICPCGPCTMIAAQTWHTASGLVLCRLGFQSASWGSFTQSRPTHAKATAQAHSADRLGLVQCGSRARKHLQQVGGLARRDAVLLCVGEWVRGTGARGILAIKCRKQGRVMVELCIYKPEMLCLGWYRCCAAQPFFGISACASAAAAYTWSRLFCSDFRIQNAWKGYQEQAGWSSGAAWPRKRQRAARPDPMRSRYSKRGPGTER